MAVNLLVGLIVLVVTGLLLKLMSEYRQDENRQLSERLERLEAENAHLTQENHALHMRLGDATNDAAGKGDTSKGEHAPSLPTPKESTMTSATPTFPLLTERLTLRPYAEGDFEDYKTYYSRDDVATYLYWSPGDEAKLRDSFATRQTQYVWQAGAPLVLAAERKSDARVIGEVLLVWRNAEQREGELGFVFHPDVHGQGYAREASLAMLELGFATFGLHRIIGRCDARNTASYTLMERLGMRREAHFIDNEYLKGEWTSELVYALLEREWREIRP